MTELGDYLIWGAEGSRGVKDKAQSPPEGWPRRRSCPWNGLGRSNKYGVGAEAREEFWETVNHWKESLAPQDLGSELSGALGPGRQPEVLALSWRRGQFPSWSRPLSVWQAQSLASGRWE